MNTIEHLYIKNDPSLLQRVNYTQRMVEFIQDYGYMFVYFDVSGSTAGWHCEPYRSFSAQLVQILAAGGRPGRVTAFDLKPLSKMAYSGKEEHEIRTLFEQFKRLGGAGTNLENLQEEIRGVVPPEWWPSVGILIVTDDTGSREIENLPYPTLIANINNHKNCFDN